MSIKTLRILTNMTQKQFAEFLEIPKRTIEDWECERRKPPKYIVDLIEYKLKNENLI